MVLPLALEPKLLDILIPTYKRPNSAVIAAHSALSQIRNYGLQKHVNVLICDDCSPFVRIENLRKELSCYQGLFEIHQNSFNKGMSRNIFGMVSASESEFCTILSDDDWLEPMSLIEIIKELAQLNQEPDRRSESGIGALFTPRHSYTDDDSLHCVTCRPFHTDRVIATAPCNVLRHAGNAFILTGLIFRPGLIDIQFWRQHIDNAFFPIVYFASIASKSNVKYVNRKWFHHLCLNECHWEAWGATQRDRTSRLHSDYLKALIAIREKYSGRCFWVYLWVLLRQLSSFQGPLHDQPVIVMSLVFVCPLLMVAFPASLLLRATRPPRRLLRQGLKIAALNVQSQ